MDSNGNPRRAAAEPLDLGHRCDPADLNTITVVDGGFGGAHAWRGMVNMAGTAATWTDLSGTAPAAPGTLPSDAVAVDPGAVGTFYAGSDVGVWRTTDDGATGRSSTRVCRTRPSMTSSSKRRRGSCAPGPMAAGCGSGCSTWPRYQTRASTCATTSSTPGGLQRLPGRRVRSRTSPNTSRWRSVYWWQCAGHQDRRAARLAADVPVPHRQRQLSCLRVAASPQRPPAGVA